ncbi:MAG: SdrD B-like domain-containing protein, partial [Candidatus Paceibacterota bacterium]
MTTSVDAIASGTVTITYDITFANGEKCQKKVDLDCSVPTVVCCDKVKVEPVVDATGKASCCAKITTTCEVKSISVIVSNGTISSASWNCPATIPTGYVGQTAYTFAPGSCPPVMTTCVNAIKSGMVTITYDIVFASGETCQKTIRLDCAVASDCVTPPAGMVLWLPGDGNANDISGLTNHGTLAGGTAYSTGKVAAAFKVGNYMDQITVADNSSLNFGTGNFSADAWIKTTDNIHTIAIADKRVPVGSNMFGYGLFITQGKLYFQMGDGSASLNQVVLNVQLADGIWHFVAATVDRKLTDGGKLYIDGSLALTFDPTSKPNSISNTIPLIVAQNNIANLTATSYTFYLDEVELFNRAITGTEIASIYNAGSAGKCKLGSICGTKFNDLNGNGRRDKDEPGIPEWKIMIGGTADLTTITDKDGNYCFYNLEPGEYKIGEGIRAGWQQMVPATPGTYTLILPAGQNLTGLDFGNRLIPQTGSICGSKFNDLNGNGRRDEGEPGIGDWTILLGGGVTEIKVTTDKNGDFCFENLNPGEYKLGEENRVGWLQMKPAGSYNVTLAAGQNLIGQDFGHMLDSRPASICGIKFNDLNGDGHQDLNEPGLPNWTINLTGSATITAVTDGKGNYCFTGLKPGTYTVSEVNQALWHQTTPHPTGTYTITLAADENLFNQNFGNQHDLECVTPPIGMLGWWPGDDNANDMTLNGDFGTLVNGATFGPGIVGSAFSLMGSTDYVNIPDRPQLNPASGDFTIDCWIQTSEAVGTFAILDKRALDANQNYSGYGLYVVDGHLQFRLSDSAGNGFVAALFGDNTTMIADGQWHFVAAKVEQGTNHAVTVAIDGVVGAGNTWGYPILSYSNNADLRIGEAYFSTYSNNSPAGHYHNFQGMIDEVEFIYGALSDAELVGIYNAGSAGKCKPAIQLGTVCGTKFNDLNGNGIRDARGDGEPGLPNWTIKLTGAANMTTTTDANGNFCFNNLPAGQYTIAEVNQVGWIQTAPLNPNTFTVTLLPGAHIE